MPNTALAIRPAILGVYSGGVDVNIDTHLVDPCFLPDNICLHESALNAFLDAVMEVVVDNDPIDVNVGEYADGYCDLMPANFNNVGTAPSSLGWGDDAVADVTVIVGFPLLNKLAAPLELAIDAGDCPQV